MNEQLRNQIEAMVDHDVSAFIDTYQCDAWGITAKEFANYLIEEFSKTIMEVADELDTEEEEDE